MRVYARLASTTYKINEVAKRSGFTPATLRYYEEVGLVPLPTRTEAGYRMYDDRALERLAFIARAKQLGCTLEETADLVVAWEGGQCGPIHGWPGTPAARPGPRRRCPAVGRRHGRAGLREP